MSRRMSRRRYLCDIVGTGADGDDFRPALADVHDHWGCEVDLRSDGRLATGQMVVYVEADDERHNEIGRDRRNQPIPDGARLQVVQPSMMSRAASWVKSKVGR